MFDRLLCGGCIGIGEGVRARKSQWRPCAIKECHQNDCPSSNLSPIVAKSNSMIPMMSVFEISPARYPKRTKILDVCELQGHGGGGLRQNEQARLNRRNPRHHVLRARTEAWPHANRQAVISVQVSWKPGVMDEDGRQADCHDNTCDRSGSPR